MPEPSSTRESRCHSGTPAWAWWKPLVDSFRPTSFACPTSANSSMAEVPQPAEADRREVAPPMQVEVATCSKLGSWSGGRGERRQWWGRVRGGTAVNGGSEPLIFAPAQPRALITGRDWWIGILGGNEFVFFPRVFGNEGYGLFKTLAPTPPL
jgi:hypothetical protein